MKEHDIVEVIVDDYEFITTPNETTTDEFEVLPKGTQGTIVSPPKEEEGGCYVEFPYIQEKYPGADSVLWVLYEEMRVVQ